MKTTIQEKLHHVIFECDDVLRFLEDVAAKYLNIGKLRNYFEGWEDVSFSEEYFTFEYSNGNYSGDGDCYHYIPLYVLFADDVDKALEEYKKKERKDNKLRQLKANLNYAKENQNDAKSKEKYYTRQIKELEQEIENYGA